MIPRLLLQAISLLTAILKQLNSLATKVDGIIKEQAIQSGKLDTILIAVKTEPAVKVVFNIEREDGQIQLGVTSMTMKDNEKVKASVVFLDAKKNPAQVDGVPVWAGSNDAAFTVTAAADGLSADVVAVNIGSGQVTVTADADLGAGVTTITGTLDVSIIAGNAVTVQINTDPPMAQ